jgi:UDP-2,3-diacylglucosamine pyrophosphatase LpxH
MKLHDNYNMRFLLGDIHGAWRVIPNHLISIDMNKVCYIQVGDFRIGYDPIEVDKKNLLILNEILSESDSHLLVIRGNHDNPSWFIDENFREVKDLLTNILFVQDYSVLNIDGENFLFIGGAVSIDRESSKKKDMINGTKSYWIDEVVNFDYDFAKNVRNIDRIVCHTSPDFCSPVRFNDLVYSYAQRDSLLLRDLREERSKMTELVTEIKKNNNVKGFYNGHFHSDHYFYHEGTEFVALGINVFKQI